MRTRHLNGLLIVASLLVSTAPLYAQRQQQNVAKLKADARNAVGIIGGRTPANGLRRWLSLASLLQALRGSLRQSTFFCR